LRPCHRCLPGRAATSGWAEIQQRAMHQATRSRHTGRPGDRGMSVPAQSGPLLEAHDLARSYEVSRGLFGKPGIVRALAGVSFSLEAGKTLAVVGESGCGKSTLARLLTMIEPPSSGHLSIDGKDVANADASLRRALRREIQIVFQNPYGSLNPRQTVA